MMKKYTAILAALVLCLFYIGVTADTSASDAAQPDICGAWYAVILEDTITMTIKPDGTSTLEVPEEEPEVNEWIMRDEKFVLDPGTPGEIAFDYDGETLKSGFGDMEFLFTREKPQPFAPGERIEHPALEDFNGKWAPQLVEVDGRQYKPDTAGLDIRLSIENGEVAMTLKIYTEARDFEMVGTLENGTFTCAREMGAAFEDGGVYILNLHEDGTMSLLTQVVDKAATIYLTKE